MVTERQIREDYNVSAIFLIYSIFSNRNQISLFSHRACDKVITMTGKKKWGARARWWAIAIFQLTELNMTFVWVIDQVWGQDAGYWPSSFFVCLGTDTKPKSINSKKKRSRPISSHLDRANLVNKRFIIWLSGKFFLWDTAGTPERARWLHLTHSGSQSKCAISVILPDRGASHIVRWVIDQVWSWDGWILVIQALFCVCLFTETQ